MGGSRAALPIPGLASLGAHMALFEPSSHRRSPAWERKWLRLLWVLRVSAGNPGQWVGGGRGGIRAVSST